MDQRIISIFFALLRSAFSGTRLTNEELNNYSPHDLQELFKLSSCHDITHLLILGLKQNELLSPNNANVEKCILGAVYRYEKINDEYEQLCDSLEEAQIPFVPLKGSVIRKYYPEPWMRTSCDIDVLVRREDLSRALSYLVENRQYTQKEFATHDVSLYSVSGVHVELHFDLVEEGRANNSVDVLRSVWDSVSLCQNKRYQYEMSDEFFYFYHIAHMAKHFENGGCGIRPFIDLWILECLSDSKYEARNELLDKGDLRKFADVCRDLSAVWFSGAEHNKCSRQMEEFILHGGIYGSADNRVALQQKKRGGRVGYIFSRMFISYSALSRYYPILKKHRWLMPFMQVRRWFMLLKPDVAQMAAQEMKENMKLEKKESDNMNSFLNDIGLK